MKKLPILLTILLVLSLLFTHLLNRNNKQLKIQLSSANTTIKRQVQSMESMLEQIDKINNMDQRLQQELNNATQNIELLEYELSTQQRRLYINTSCATMPTHTTTTSVVNERATELDANSRQNYLRLRQEIELAALQIKGLQAYIKALPSSCVANR